jgi:drug/metabolite transporter (DMT)-like permease
MTEEKGVAYILGIISLVLAFFQPIAAIIIAIIGLVHNRKEKSRLAKKLNIIAIIVGVIMFVITVISVIYGIMNSTSFPVY